jgi:transmembrane sensor
MNNKKAEELIKKYLNKTCTPEEEALLESWYIKKTAEEEQTVTTPDYFELESEIWTELKRRKRQAPKLNWLIAAAAVASIVICSVVYFSYRNTKIQTEKKYSSNKIIPGENKAELILADGSKIDLNEAKSGILAKQPGVSIIKMDSGQLAYATAPESSSTDVTYNTLVTPKGGQYQINLPDDTKVWLNAASSLKFPTAFNGKERIVELSGEAYFEVASNKEKPFKVKSSIQTIQVLGTHFNVNSYSDEPVIKTSLLKGSVRVSLFDKTVIIKPGEETVFHTDSHKLSIKKGNAEDAVAWKNGYFQFNNENIESIMRKISRWYNVDIVYQEGFIKQRFGGTISRFDNVSKVLRMLELTGAIHFKIAERRIIVMR